MVTLKTATVERINNSVTLKGNNVIGYNCNTFSQECVDEEKNNSVSHSEKWGYRVTLDEEMTPPIAIDGCNPNIEGGVTLGYTSSDDVDYGGYTSSGDTVAEESCSSLLRKALKNYAWSLNITAWLKISLSLLVSSMSEHRNISKDSDCRLY